MGRRGLILISKIWEGLVIWAVLAIWVEIKALSSHLMDKIWAEWVEWILVRYSKCLWVEEEEDLAVVSDILVKEENRQIKHHRQKEKNSVILLSRDLILTVLEVQALDHSEGASNSKRVNRKNDFLI